ncbi:hypothetical protein CVT24_011011 [Panaeolus cyanescens]|uniref:Uncharacterized protein n=1 Tax=Panaeolus cyanescens TaxID=181874 RepID=A0A409YVC4_9AGAR|nr:hypothetical protein CVT24_011011 [Panaeolus cyanescens]
MRVYLSPTAQTPVPSSATVQPVSQSTSNTSAVSALRGRLNTMSLQSPGSPSKAAHTASVSNNVPSSSTNAATSKVVQVPNTATNNNDTASNATPNVAQLQAEFGDLKEIVWKLIKSNNRLKEDTSQLKNEVNDLKEEAACDRDEITLLKSEQSTLREELKQLRAENRDIIECQSALADLIASIQSEIGRPEDANDDGPEPSVLVPVPVILTPPGFNSKADRFYVVLQGRCPGVYSNLVWVKKLTNGLESKDCTWQKANSYQEARALYEEGERLNEIKIVDRDFPNDASTYGPIIPFVPWRQS